MARPREYDADDVLDKAMQVFWQHGYEGAFLPDLLSGMGLTRGSLYRAFKDRKNLFLLACDRYEAAQVDRAVPLLTDKDVPNGQDRILRVFQGVVSAFEQVDHRGCLLCTAAAGSAAGDDDIARKVKVGLSKLQGAFHVALQDAARFQGLEDTHKRRLADAMLTQYVGLRMLARSGLSLGVFDNSVQMVGDILDSAA